MENLTKLEEFYNAQVQLAKIANNALYLEFNRKKLFFFNGKITFKFLANEDISNLSIKTVENSTLINSKFEKGKIYLSFLKYSFKFEISFKLKDISIEK